MANVDVLKIGENEYTKLKYLPLDMAEIGTKYINLVADGKIDELNKMYRDALLKISVNGNPFNNESEINQHFAKFPKEIREVRIWALMEGLTSFLESFMETPDLEAKYMNS